MNKLFLLMGMALLMGACTSPAPAPIVEPPLVVAPDFSSLVGTWTGPWTGESGLLKDQSGTVSLTVAPDGKVSCTLTQKSTAGGVIPDSTSACGGTLVLNTSTPPSVAIDLKYTYPKNPEVSATGSARVYFKDTAKNIIGALNNVVTGTAGPGQFSDELGNLYFELSK